MYTHCMFCQAGLGANEEVEHFPVGRRLAYDQVRGRLWVVCPRCHRWNLTPLEERWEAVEECERTFRTARLRASTENISIARTASRMDLVRIGEPLRRELAFWRWGDRFGARRKKVLIWGGVGVAAAATAGIVNITTGGGAFVGLMGGMELTGIARRISRRTKVETDSGRSVVLGTGDVRRARFAEPDASGAPTLAVTGWWHREQIITGERAVRAAALILPRLNAGGAGDDVVYNAADAIEDRGGPEEYVRSTWGDMTRAPVWARPLGPAGRPGVLALLPLRTRVALEMALHEDEERKALNGELAGLEAMWRAAEEIADISDNLLLPKGWEAFRNKHKGDDPGARPE